MVTGEKRKPQTGSIRVLLGTCWNRSPIIEKRREIDLSFPSLIRVYLCASVVPLVFTATLHPRRPHTPAPRVAFDPRALPFAWREACRGWLRWPERPGARRQASIAQTRRAALRV